MTLFIEGAAEAEVGGLARNFPYLRATMLKGSDWLLSMNARTLVELWRDPRGRDFAGMVVSELESRNVCPIFDELAFGVKAHAS